MSGQTLLKVNMLGEFTLMYGENTIGEHTSRSRKLWLLLAYLATFRDRAISQDDLIRLLWPEDTIGNPANTLKTLLHRVRSMVDELDTSFGKKLILCRRGTYAWNSAVDVEVDTEVFEGLCRKAEKTSDDAEKLDILLEALALYKGDFLPKASLEDWVVPIVTYYHSLYMNAVHDTLRLLQAQNRWEDIISVSQRAAAIDPYDEILHSAMIRALCDSGAQQSAMQHYEYITKLFYTQFGVTPSEELMSLYREIAKTTNALQTDLNIIKDELMDSIASQTVNGAFFCEYGFFKDFYQVAVRSLSRSGQASQLALVTIAAEDGMLSAKRRNSAMERMQEIIHSTLRRGDVYTRYSVTQYLVMLPSSSFENGEKVLQRVVRTFKREYPKMPIDVNYTILPVDVEV